MNINSHHFFTPKFGIPQFGALATKEEFKRIQQIARKHHLDPNLIDYQKTEVAKHSWFFRFLPKRLQAASIAAPILMRKKEFNPQKSYFAVLETFSKVEEANEEFKKHTGLKPMHEGEDYIFQVLPKEVLSILSASDEFFTKATIEGEWTEITPSPQGDHKTTKKELLVIK